MNCGAISSTKDQNVTIPANYKDGGCGYTLNAYNDYVCQVKIYFHSFSLLQPEVTLTKIPVCQDEYFIVDGVDMKLCGENSGQHCMYI